MGFESVEDDYSFLERHLLLEVTLLILIGDQFRMQILFEPVVVDARSCD